MNPDDVVPRNIPLVSLREGYLANKSELDAAVARVLDGGLYILGQEVKDFEKEFAHWCGVAHGIGVANGTDAIVIALRALNIGPGDAVFTVSHTAVATVAAIELAGAIPVLVDVDAASFTIDPAKLEEAICRAPNDIRPRAVVAVHLYGHPCDLDAIGDVCRRYGLSLVEDCAQAHGARWRGLRVGNFGVVASFSFYPTKNLGAFGDGGAIVTNDSTVAERAKALRQYGWRERFMSDIAGMNSRLDELQAALLRVRLARLETDIAARQKIAETYDTALSDTVKTPEVSAGAQHAYHLYVVRVPERDRFASELKERGIGTGVHYPMPIHMQKAYTGRVALAPSGLGVTEHLAGDILSLPMYPYLRDTDVDYVIESVRAVSRMIK